MTSKQVILIQKPHDEELQEYFSKSDLKFTSFFVEKVCNCKTLIEFLNASICAPDIFIKKSIMRKLIHEFRFRGKSFMFADISNSNVDLNDHDYILFCNKYDFYGYISKDQKKISQSPLSINAIIKEIFPSSKIQIKPWKDFRFGIKNAFYVRWLYFTEKAPPDFLNNDLYSFIHDIYINCINIDRQISEYLVAIDAINNKNPVSIYSSNKFLGLLINWYKNQSTLPFPLYYKTSDQPDLILESKFTKAVSVSNEKEQYVFKGVKIEKPNVSSFKHKKVVELNVHKPTITPLNLRKSDEIVKSPPKEEQTTSNNTNDLSLVYLISEGYNLMIRQDGYPCFCPAYVSKTQPIKIKVLDAKFKPINHRIQFYCYQTPKYSFSDETKESNIYIDEYSSNISLTIYFTDEFYTNLFFNFQIIEDLSYYTQPEKYSILCLNQSQIWISDNTQIKQ